MRSFSIGCLGWVLAVLVVQLGAGPAVLPGLRAQALPAAVEATTGAWFPAASYFAPPLADPSEIRMAAGLYGTDLFDPSKPSRERPDFTFSDPASMRRDVHGAVALGGTLPLWRAPERADRGLLFGVQAGVFARFRVEEPSRDYAASDWLVAMPVEFFVDRLSGRVRVLHRSAHLGDELMGTTGASRIEYGHEAVDALLAFTLTPGARLYGGGAWVFRSNTRNEPTLRSLGERVLDVWVAQLGADGEWFPWADGRVGLLAGIDWRGAQESEWRGRTAAAVGLGARGEAGGLRLLLRYFDGPSPVGEFFLTDERFWGLEVVAEF